MPFAGGRSSGPRSASTSLWAMQLASFATFRASGCGTGRVGAGNGAMPGDGDDETGGEEHEGAGDK